MKLSRFAASATDSLDAPSWLRSYCRPFPSPMALESLLQWDGRQSNDIFGMSSFVVCCIMAAQSVPSMWLAGEAFYKSSYIALYPALHN
ncbi:Piso0_003864 [Millerozyma farinosa CBS 7064]|uniref:Piso0_003864 protein n=1 Tax=Pichia sorbitophila (strain ATCC MYA-4447 / BCRC 22081 / CBS 7064 / NBRC 10061 / NRRL Y-12695) TaxID=559304 RepID=G8Y9Q8_PICSO|nr:Piso0_003864 [Millerozyma farinosa CBS 7064]CCE84322.1 Piso0_003864 [Millerozyma farinosa CBS 7064]